MIITRDHVNEAPMCGLDSYTFYTLYKNTRSSLAEVKQNFRDGKVDSRNLVAVGMQSLTNYFVMEEISGSMADERSRNCLLEIDKSIQEVISLRYAAA